MLALKALVFISVVAYKANALVNLDDAFTFSWKELPFAWPSEDAKNVAIKDGDYIPVHNLPLGLDRWKNKLFVTIPRWKSGVAASLGYISLDGPANRTDIQVIPYPDWKANTLPKGDDKPQDDNHIISVFRLSVDVCDRLWVMDTGLADILGDPKQISPPAIVIYDLKTDKLIRRYVLKDDDLKHDSFFANIVVDVNETRCDDAYAYIPDLGGYGIVTYSLKDNDSWRFKHNFFHFDPLHGDFTVGGVNFQWTDGVFGLALTGEDEQGCRTMYFHPLASLNEFSVNTSVLRNKTLAADPHIYNLFKLEGTKGDNSQTSASVFDEVTNTLFLTQLNKDAVACWNTKKPLEPKNVDLVVQDHTRLIFTNDIKIDADRNLWILSDRMPQFIYGSLNEKETNYRIIRVNVDDAIRGTACAA